MADKIKVLYLINSVCLFQTNSYIHAVHTPFLKTHFFPPIILPRSGASYTCYWNFSSLKITSNQEKLIPNADNIINKGSNCVIRVYIAHCKITACACINDMVQHHYYVFHVPLLFFLQTIDRRQILPEVRHM